VLQRNTPRHAKSPDWSPGTGTTTGTGRPALTAQTRLSSSRAALRSDIRSRYARNSSTRCRRCLQAPCKRSGRSGSPRRAGSADALERHRKPRHQSDELPLSHRIAAVAPGVRGPVPPSERTARLGARVLSAPVWGNHHRDPGRRSSPSTPSGREVARNTPPDEMPGEAALFLCGTPARARVADRLRGRAGELPNSEPDRLTAASAPAGPPCWRGRSASAELRSPSGLAPFDAGGNPLNGHQPEKRNEQFRRRVRREEYRPVPILLSPS
jgi:hypothetical protein